MPTVRLARGLHAQTVWLAAANKSGARAREREREPKTDFAVNVATRESNAAEASATQTLERRANESDTRVKCSRKRFERRVFRHEKASLFSGRFCGRVAIVSHRLDRQQLDHYAAAFLQIAPFGVS